MTMIHPPRGEVIGYDCESTYSAENSVADKGPTAYANCPDTDVYLISVQGGGFNYTGHPSGFDHSQLNGKHICAHNAAFDSAMCAGAISRGLIQPFTATWHCTMDLCSFVRLPSSLKNASAVAFNEPLDKRIRTMMKGKDWNWVVSKGRDQQLRDYCQRDTELSKKLWDQYAAQWPEKEQRLSQHTRLLQERGISIDTEKLAIGLERLQYVCAQARKKVPWVSGPEDKVSSLPAIRSYCESVGLTPPVSMAKTSDEFITWAEQHGAEHPWIKAVADWRSANRLVETLRTMELQMYNGRMPVPLRYHGAHTGRWSGGSGSYDKKTGKINLQNLPVATLHGVNVRNLLIPKDGHVFINADLNAIEPRIQYWLVEDEQMLEQLKAGTSVYEGFARARLGWRGGDLKQEDPALYKGVKAQVLSLAYGAGAKRYLGMAKTMAGLTLGYDEAAYQVSQWRRMNPNIVDYWDSLEGAIEDCMYDKTDCSLTMDSGRTITWLDPHVTESNTNDLLVRTMRGGAAYKTWGSKCFENLVQAQARDVLADVILKVEEAGIQVLLHIHDELVCEVREEDAEEALATVLQIMSTSPEWAPDLPLGAEGSIIRCYDK